MSALLNAQRASSSPRTAGRSRNTGPSPPENCRKGLFLNADSGVVSGTPSQRHYFNVYIKYLFS
jgi:hypothetical protein